MLLVSPLFSLILPCPLFSLLSLSSLFVCTPSQTYTKSARHAQILTNESIKFFSCTKPNKITVSSPLSVFHKPTTTKKSYTSLIQAHMRSTFKPIGNQSLYPIFQTLIAKLKTPNITFYKPKSTSKSLNPYNQQKLNP